MPDTTQAVPFWTSVATTFKGNDAVIFDLFNEPYPGIATGSESQGWLCWRDGGSACMAPGLSYPVAGMQSSSSRTSDRPRTRTWSSTAR